MGLNFFGKKRKEIPQTYQPVLEAKEVIALFGRTTLHQQAALLRLRSRNIAIDVDGQVTMGYELDWNLEGAMIVGRLTEPEEIIPAQQSLPVVDGA